GFSTPPPPDPSVPDIEEEVGLYPPPHVVATTNDLWILFPDRLSQYDRHSGNSKQEIPLNTAYSGLTGSDTGITVISADESDHRVITRIRLADGTVQTEPLEAAAAETPPANRRPKPATGMSATNSLGTASAARPAEHA